MPRALTALSLIPFAVLLAQTPQPAFEVASVKPSGPRPTANMPAGGMITGGPGTADPSQITYSRAPMKRILATAFGVQNDQIIGPDWLQDQSIDGLRYEIAAKVPPGTTKADANLMLQNLLAERFHLAYHRDKKDFPVYELALAKGGSKLKQAAEADGPLPRSRSLERPCNGPLWIRTASRSSPPVATIWWEQ